MGATGPGGSNYAYVTLITRSSYLPGVVILAHTLQEHGSTYPLIVLYTPSLTAVALRALELEAAGTNLLLLQEIEPLRPSRNEPLAPLVQRYQDTWTKLRVFDILEIPCSKYKALEAYKGTNGNVTQRQGTHNGLDLLCYLDADMMVCKNMDSVFHATPLEDEWIAACRDCICNLDGDPWAPSYCNPTECPLTHQGHLRGVGQQSLQSALGYGLNTGMSQELLKAEDVENIRHFNSGMFLFRPCESLWKKMLDFFLTTPLLSSFRFPDQDFLRYFFKFNWHPLPWQYNALKTFRYHHCDLWSDEEVICLHYVVDKPWVKRNAENGLAGYKGKDGATHRLWWAAFERWREARKAMGEDGAEILMIVTQFVAGKNSMETEEMKAIGSRVTEIRDNWESIESGGASAL